jgi:hypothetical protein
MKLFLLNAPRYLPYYIAMLEDKKEQGILLITENLNLLDVYIKVLDECKNDLPFLEYQVLNEKYFKIPNNDFHKIKYRQQSLKKIKSLFEKYSIDTVVLSNDGLLYAQYALSLNKNGNNIYLEDGMYNYLKVNKKSSLASKFIQTPLHQWLYPKLYFKDWQSTQGIGNNSNITELYFSHPKHIYYKPTKPTKTLIKNYFIHQSVFITKLLQNFKLSTKSLIDLDFILLLEYPENKQNYKKYIKEVLSLCQELSVKNLTIALKKHPRDFNHYQKINNLTNTFFLPEIAFEFLLPFISKKTIILGGVSTSLMLANALLDNSVFLTTSSNFQNTHLMHKLGIKNYE